MYRRILLVFTLIAAGCASQDKPKEKLVLVQPAPEMAVLETLVGTWEGTGEMISAVPASMRTALPQGVELSSTVRGERHASMAFGGHFLKVEGWYSFGPDLISNYTEYVTWDAAWSRYRAFYFSDLGGAGEGWWTPTETGKGFDVLASGTRPDGSTKGRSGSMVFVSDDTIQWTWKEYAVDGYLEMRGTSSRK